MANSTSPAPTSLAAQDEILKAQREDIEALRAQLAELKAQQGDIAALKAQIAELKAAQAASPGVSGNVKTELPVVKDPKAGDGNPGTSSGGASGSGASAPAPAKKWYDSINLRGYTQVRYNRLFETNPDLRNEQGDRSIGGNNSFFLRRIRLIFSGQLNSRVSFYLQPDFASSASSNSLNFGQLRDAYFDVGLDSKNEFRVRLGQSKIPFGFENLQSSQNRLALDRSDGINSAFSNERDLGAFLMWAPDKIRKRFASLVNDGLKGSGDYGVLAFGAFNGQIANRPELNNNRHLVARASYPFEVGRQIIEPHLQAYSGNFVIPTDQISSGVKFASGRSYQDRRAGVGFTMYPRPFGIQAEYNWGRGPEFNPLTDSIESQRLKGGYVLLSYQKKLGKHTLIPFTRYHYYDGGKKHELDARSYRVSEYEIGLEWQPSKQFELTAMYTIAGRRYEDFVRQNNFQRGRLLRLQAQVNY